MSDLVRCEPNRRPERDGPGRRGCRSGQVGRPGGAAGDQRDIIYTANALVRVDDVEVASIEAELSQRESEIESLQGRLRVLEDESTLATIDVTYSEDVEIPVEDDDDDAPGFVQALKAGVTTLANVGRVVLVVVGFLLPFVPFAIAGWFLVRWLVRRRHRTRSEPGSAPGTAGLPPFPQAPGPDRPNPPTAPGSPDGDDQ